MKITIEDGYIKVERLDSPKVYKNSTLMYHIKKELMKEPGMDVITKDLSKEDGNLLSPGCYGIIDRQRNFQIYYPNYLVYDAYAKYNQGCVILSMVQ